MNKVQIRFLYFLIVFLITIPSIGQSWTKIYGNVYDDEAVNMMLGKKNTIYTIENHVTTNDGIEVCKFDSSGNLIWNWKPEYFKNGQTSANDFSINSNEDIFITGWLSDSVQIGDSIYTNSKNVLTEFFISKMDSSNQPIWTIRAKSIDSLTNELIISEGLSVEVSKKNKLYVLATMQGDFVIGKDSIYNNEGAHNYLIKMDTSGAIEWFRDCDCNPFKLDTSGNYYTVTTNILKKYDDNGNLLWQRIYGSTINPIYQMELNDLNDLYIITDTTLRKINISSGLEEWNTGLNTYLNHKISSDSQGNVLVAGNSKSKCNNGTYFESFSKTGKALGGFCWAYPLVNDFSTPSSIKLLNNGNIYAYGELNVISTNISTFVFGVDTLSNIGSFDTYLSKIQTSDWFVTEIQSKDLEFNYLVYPNPTTDILIIEHIDSNPSKSEYSLYNLLGAEIQNNKMNDDITELNLSQLDPGIYLLRITNNLGSSTIKIIKK